MKVAVPCTETDEVYQHFGKAHDFAVYEYNGGNYVDRKMISTKCEGHEQIAKLMRHLGINIVVCGGIGDGAISALTEYGIIVYSGVEGDINKAYYDLTDGKLTCTATPTCGSSACSCGSGSCSCGCCS